MNIRKFSLIFLAPIFFASIAELAMVIRLGEINNALKEVTDSRRNMRIYAEEMRMTSQVLTRFARSYVITKDPRMMTWYNQVADIRDGKIARPKNYNTLYWDLVADNVVPPPDGDPTNGSPLLTLFKRVSISDLANQRVVESKIASDDLMSIEKTAFHAMNGEFDDGTETFRYKKNPDPKFAREILYDDAYVKAKSRVMIPLAEAMKIIDEVSNKKISEMQGSFILAKNIQLYISCSIVSWVLMGGIFFRNRVVSRLVEIRKSIDDAKVSNLIITNNVRGSDEIGAISEALTSMSKKVSTAFGDIESKVSSVETISKQMEMERNQSDKILHNILPSAIAARIRRGETVIAETYPEVSVLFADIVDFTSMASKIGPYQTVRILNDIFGLFDSLAEKHQVEKIKTIGDCYMAVSGVPMRDPLHCQHIADFALEAIEVIKNYQMAEPYSLKIRIGIHAGTIAAGVVGKNKFSFDVWGDVVNLADRFQSTGQPNRVHVSESVHQRLFEDFEFDSGGIVNIKGRGIMPSWFLLRRKISSSEIVDLNNRRILKLT